MNTEKSDLLLLKAIIKTNLKKSELAVLVDLMQIKGKTITRSNSESAKSINMAQPNYVRALNALKSANIDGTRANGIFIKSKASWGRKSTDGKTKKAEEQLNIKGL